VCQMLAAIRQQALYTVNCHMHTESSDFLGGLRPVRDHATVSVLYCTSFVCCSGLGQHSGHL
jgi:midasin